ncbi:MAG TPA: DUF695 domain-containing protein [Candidatus Acidoferrum sp.]|nr:DUF695 domain-containing protein [Candidatus Acidoferrum sp.]
MPEDWNFYICNVNDKLSSIFLNLGLRQQVPDKCRPNLLWVWVYLRWPREDGLSDSSEFEWLKAIEEQLTASLAERFDAVLCGRITTDGRREFYYYAARTHDHESTVNTAMNQFRDYEFDFGFQADPGWKQYLDVLYPSEESRQCMENRKVLDVLEEKGDSLKAPRDVWHWIYFHTKGDRERFRDEVLTLEYRVQSFSDKSSGNFPFGICIVRFQSVDPAEIDDAIIELFRMAKKHCGDYDGWETQVISE